MINYDCLCHFFIFHLLLLSVSTHKLYLVQPELGSLLLCHLVLQGFQVYMTTQVTQLLQC